MEEFKGTPGPWKAQSGFTDTITIISESDNKLIALIASRRKNENAELMAAAPELLKACIKALTLSDKIFIQEGYTGRTGETQEAYDAVKNAINKALGKTNNPQPTNSQLI